MFEEMVASGNGYFDIQASPRINQSLQCDHLHTKRKRKGSSLRRVFVFFFIRAQISRNEMSKCGDANSSVSPFWYRITQAIQKRINRTRSFFSLSPKNGFALNNAGNTRTDVVVLIEWVCEFHTIVEIWPVFLLLLILYAVGGVWHSGPMWQTLEIPKPISSIYIIVILVQMPQQNTNNAQIEFEGEINGSNTEKYPIDSELASKKKKNTANSPLNILNKL